MKEITRFEDIPIEKVVIDRFQVRKANVGMGVDELAKSLETYGLLQPIIVIQYEKNPEKWELVCGQRRLMACKMLKRKTIRAGIVEGKLTLEEGIAVSGTENVFQLGMSRSDLVDLCEELYRKYGTIKAVWESTRLPYEVVRKYVRYSRLKPFLQKMVDNKDIEVDLALKTQDAASASGTYNEKEAKTLIDVLMKSDNALRNRILDLRKSNPDTTVEKIIKKAEEPVKTVTVKLTLGETLGGALRDYAEEEGADTTAAAEGLIKEALTSKGYIGS